MFILNDDMSIYITRGDTAVISVDATDQNGNAYVFQPGDVVRFKVVEKKNYDNVVLQRDLAVEAETTRALVLLEEKDTRIGDVISKPVDYWYEVELNPFTNPQTIVGYDDYGAKIFKLLPEGKDIEVEITEEDVPVVDAELSLTSERPIQNQAVARAMMNISDTVEETETRVLNAVETVEAFDEEIAEIKAGIEEVNKKLDVKASKSDLESVSGDLNTSLSEIMHRQNNALWLGDYKAYGTDGYAYRDKDIWKQVVQSTEAVNDNALFEEVGEFYDLHPDTFGKALNKLYWVRENGYELPDSISDIITSGNLSNIITCDEVVRLMCNCTPVFKQLYQNDNTIISNELFRKHLPTSRIAVKETIISNQKINSYSAEATLVTNNDVILVSYYQSSYAGTSGNYTLYLYDKEGATLSLIDLGDCYNVGEAQFPWLRCNGLRIGNQYRSDVEVALVYIDLGA